MRIGFYAAAKYDDTMIRMNGPAFGLAYISAYLRQQFPGEIEEIFLCLDPESLIARKPDLVGISSFTYAYGEALQGAAVIRAALPEVPIVLGGPHISALPGNLSRDMDIGVVGEGEVPMREIVRLWLERDLSPARLREISGLVFWNDAGALERSLCPDKRIDDLDMLPHPERSLLQASWSGQKYIWTPTLSTSRGCPFTCNFCMYSKSANLVRYHSIDWSLREIENIVRDHPDLTHLAIIDDLFVTKKSRLRELGAGIRAAGLHKRLTFGCMAKASFFDAEFAQLLREMNVTTVAFGFESGSDSVLHYLKDKRSSVAKNQRAMDLCYDQGIQVSGYFIIGAPDETQADMAKTYWFIRNNHAQMPIFNVNMLLALPGTEVWQEAKAAGLVDEDFKDWDAFSYQGIESERYFFLNRRYSRAFYMDAYNRHIFKLKEQSNDFLALHKFHNILQHAYLQEMILPQIRSRFAPGSRLLLGHRGQRMLASALASEYALTEFQPRPDSALPAGDFDGLVLLHGLEYIGFDAPAWSEIRPRGLPTLLICENAATLGRLGMLLGGAGLPYNAPDRMDNRFLYGLPQLQARLKPDFQLLQLDRNRLPRLDSPFGVEFGQMVESELRPHLRDLRRLNGFPLVYHMLQPFHQSETLQLLRGLLPMEKFMEEADVYSYTLWLQPVARPVILSAEAAGVVLPVTESVSPADALLPA